LSADRYRWDERHRRSENTGSACAVLDEHRDLLPATGKALDLAAGLGANALLLAEAGLQTCAWDFSPVALDRLRQSASARGLHVRTLEIDLESGCLPAQRFDLIVVSRYLHRPLCAWIESALRPRGLLFYETFLGDAHSGGPSNPAFRLRAGELPRLFEGLDRILYEENTAHGLARLIARKPARTQAF
jgi:2-polyprenyl-3-methyl-5-hydroxy-6-metoxy-1,4-benzoquinol methylase